MQLRLIKINVIKEVGWPVRGILEEEDLEEGASGEVEEPGEGRKDPERYEKENRERVVAVEDLL